MNKLFLKCSYTPIISRKCVGGWTSLSRQNQLSPSLLSTHFFGITTIIDVKKYLAVTDSRRTLHVSTKLSEGKTNELKNTNDSRSGSLSRFLQFFRLGGSRVSLLTVCGINMYDSCVSGVDYEYFFKMLGLPDTFHSWFLIMQLHVWMCLVRLKHEGNDGQVVYDEIVRTMWKDVEERMKLIGDVSASVRTKSMRELHGQFNGLVIAYDSGLLSDDHVLAAALWRNLMLDKTKLDVIAIEKIVCYVRLQIYSLEETDANTLFESGLLEWGDPKQILDRHWSRNI